MKHIDFTGMPVHFTFCHREDCEHHANCLHWLAYVQSPAKERSFFFDPRWIDANGGTSQCPKYLDSEPLTYARGFKHIYDAMPKAKAALLRQRLLQHFGDYNYYRYRRGEYVMSPEVQQVIRDTAAELGIDTPITFTEELQLHCWQD